ncbi:hypothetical protein [Paraburkholderia fungorum]|uniref:Uncharacterized protein n=1 Tax=Paraburkholderia fungorum TaxID=134537 RepID=A0AAW3V344_9BURK|nr:hypothetical protein [Paraburkholderia fungorum]MBB4517142.1 hypothetical protein [Paraburkholderia fungorum]MBB6204210.1 hypothetical protein [Paraburkholderia fungorum]
MARPPSAMRMRITVPTHHAVLRHMERLEEGSDANAELLRLAELGAHLEELHGPIKSVADIVKLIHSRGAAAVVPVPVPQPTTAARVEPRREVQNVDPAETAAPIAAVSQPVPPAAPPSPAEPIGGLVVDASQAALAWLPD